MVEVVKEKNKTNEENNIRSKKSGPADQEENLKAMDFVKDLINKKKEEKVLVGFRLEEEVAKTIDKIVQENNLKKSDFVNDILKRALGLK